MIDKFVDWHKKDALLKDLDAQVDAITDRVAPVDPAQGLDLLWRFMGLAGSLYERCDDSNGRLGDLFHYALTRLGPIAQAAEPAPEALADRAYDALVANDYGQYDGLVEVLAPALGEHGLSHLKERMIELSNTSVQRPPDADDDGLSDEEPEPKRPLKRRRAKASSGRGGEDDSDDGDESYRGGDTSGDDSSDEDSDDGYDGPELTGGRVKDLFRHTKGPYRDIERLLKDKEAWHRYRRHNSSLKDGFFTVFPKKFVFVFRRNSYAN